MTVENSDSSARYATNGTTGPWTVPFYFIANEDLQVYYSAGAVDTLLVLDVHYTLSGAGNPSGGTLLTTQAYAAGGFVTIQRAIDLTQEVDYLDGDGFPAETHERALDKLTMIAQQQRDAVIKALMLAPSDLGPAVLPNAAGRADRLLGFGNSGDPVASAFSLTTLNQLIALGWSNQPPPGETVLYLAGMGGADDAIGITNLAAANPFKIIKNVLSRTLNCYSECVISGDSTWIDLNGASIVQHTLDTHTLTFKPPTAGATAAFLNECGVMNGTISHSNVTSSTTGWGLYLLQCNGFKARNVRFNNGDVAVAGGQFNTFIGCEWFASVGSYKGTGSALLHTVDAPLPAGAYQKPLTITLVAPIMSASKLRDADIRVHSGDGFTIEGGYIANGLNANILILSDHPNTSISNVATVGLYNDCVRQADGTKCGIEIRDDSDPTSTVYSVQATGGWIGNGQLSGILSRKPETQSVMATGVLFLNFNAWGFDHQGGSMIDVQLTGCRFLSCGTDGVSGDVRLQSGDSYNLTGNTHRNSLNVCVSRSGTWNSGSISGCNNATGTAADTVLDALAVENELCAMQGNQSRYSGVANSWQGDQGSYLSFASNALAIAAGLQVGRSYRNGDNLCVVH